MPLILLGLKSGIFVQTIHTLRIQRFPRPSPLRRGPEKGDVHDPRPVFPRRREHAAREAERQELLASLASTRTLIQQAYGGFNTVSDSDLIESYVFEIKALQSRYDYLLRRVKELECAP